RNSEFTSPESAKSGHNDHASEQQRDSSRAEFHFRMAEVASMFSSPFSAVASGVPPTRSSSASGVFSSIVMIVTYHKVNEYAMSVGERGVIDPISALWPIAASERVFAKTAKAIARRSPGRRREASGA
ncbi:hypothetical protein OY671_010732, partial [Metschnikowia pulcherrima]